MPKTTSMPKETVAELLYFIAENERFSSVEGRLKGNFTVPQVRTMLREVASSISKEAAAEGDLDCAGAPGGFSKKTKNVISSLTPEEERKLLSAFGLISK